MPDADGARVRRRSVAERRARGLGGHRQDARAGRALRQPAAGRHRAGPHPGHHLHAQGRRGDAAAHRRAPERREPHVGARCRTLARSARSSQRHHDFHHRCVLPRTAARVSARGGRRPGLRPRRRHRGSAPDRGSARSFLENLPRPRASRRRRGAGVCAAGRTTLARRPDGSAWPPAGRAGRPAALSGGGAAGSHGGFRLRFGRGRVSPRCSRRCLAVCVSSWTAGRSNIRSSRCWRTISRSCAARSPAPIASAAAARRLPSASSSTASAATS